MGGAGGTWAGDRSQQVGNGGSLLEGSQYGETGIEDATRTAPLRRYWGCFIVELETQVE